MPDKPSSSGGSTGWGSTGWSGGSSSSGGGSGSGSSSSGVATVVKTEEQKAEQGGLKQIGTNPDGTPIYAASSGMTQEKAKEIAATQTSSAQPTKTAIPTPENFYQGAPVVYGTISKGQYVPEEGGPGKWVPGQHVYEVTQDGRTTMASGEVGLVVTKELGTEAWKYEAMQKGMEQVEIGRQVIAQQKAEQKDGLWASTHGETGKQYTYETSSVRTDWSGLKEYKPPSEEDFNRKGLFELGTTYQKQEGTIVPSGVYKGGYVIWTEQPSGFGGGKAGDANLHPIEKFVKGFGLPYRPDMETGEYYDKITQNKIDWTGVVVEMFALSPNLFVAHRYGEYKAGRGEVGINAGMKLTENFFIGGGTQIGKFVYETPAFMIETIGGQTIKPFLSYETGKSLRTSIEQRNVFGFGGTLASKTLIEPSNIFRFPGAVGSAYEHHPEGALGFVVAAVATTGPAGVGLLAFGAPAVMAASTLYQTASTGPLFTGRVNLPESMMIATFAGMGVARPVHVQTETMVESGGIIRQDYFTIGSIVETGRNPFSGALTIKSGAEGFGVRPTLPFTTPAIQISPLMKVPAPSALGAVQVSEYVRGESLKQLSVLPETSWQVGKARLDFIRSPFGSEIYKTDPQIFKNYWDYTKASERFEATVQYGRTANVAREIGQAQPFSKTMEGLGSLKGDTKAGGTLYETIYKSENVQQVYGSSSMKTYLGAEWDLKFSDVDIVSKNPTALANEMHASLLKKGYKPADMKIIEMEGGTRIFQLRGEKVADIHLEGVGDQQAALLWGMKERGSQVFDSRIKAMGMPEGVSRKVNAQFTETDWLGFTPEAGRGAKDIYGAYVGGKGLASRSGDASLTSSAARYKQATGIETIPEYMRMEQPVLLSRTVSTFSLAKVTPLPISSTLHISKSSSSSRSVFTPSVLSPSTSPSPSRLTSLSPSISPNKSPSFSQSKSLSPSFSPSASTSFSQSPSGSYPTSVTPSPSFSTSVSTSFSPNFSQSPSPSQSRSPSPSPSGGSSWTGGGGGPGSFGGSGDLGFKKPLGTRKTKKRYAPSITAAELGLALPRSKALAISKATGGFVRFGVSSAGKKMNKKTKRR